MRENEKREFLNSYRRIVLELITLREKKEELIINKISPSSMSDGMPHGTGVSDLSDYAVQMEKLESKITILLNKKNSLHKMIVKYINMINDKNEKRVLKYKYINLMSWDIIASKTGKSYRQVLRIHGKALKKMPFESIKKNN
jgi:hypothetical protein